MFYFFRLNVSQFVAHPPEQQRNTHPLGRKKKERGEKKKTAKGESIRRKKTQRDENKSTSYVRAQMNSQTGVGHAHPPPPARQARLRTRMHGRQVCVPYTHAAGSGAKLRLVEATSEAHHDRGSVATAPLYSAGVYTPASKYRHYILRQPAQITPHACHTGLIPSLPSDSTGTVAGSRHYRETTTAVRKHF